MSAPIYRYLVANLLTDKTFDELPLPAATFDVRISNPGTFQLGSPLGVASAPLGRRLRQVAAGATALYVYRNNVPWWGGVVWVANPAGDAKGNATWTLSGSTFDSYLNRVNWQHDLTTTSGDPLNQVRAILADMQADAHANISLVADTTTTGLTSPAVTYLASSNSSYGKAITDLAVQSPGFDYACSVTVDPSTGLRTRHLRLGYPQLGSGTTHVLTRPGNVLTYSLPSDATRGGTEYRAFGATANTNVAGGSQPLTSTVHTASAALTAGWPRLDAGNSYSSVTDSPTLEAHAAADLAAGTTPVLVPQVEVRLDHTDLTPDSLGDTVVLNLTDANFPDGYTQTARLIGLQVHTPDRGNPEYATLTLN